MFFFNFRKCAAYVGKVHTFGNFVNLQKVISDCKDASCLISLMLFYNVTSSVSSKYK